MDRIMFDQIVAHFIKVFNRNFEGKNEEKERIIILISGWLCICFLEKVGQGGKGKNIRYRIKRLGKGFKRENMETSEFHILSFAEQQCAVQVWLIICYQGFADRLYIIKTPNETISTANPVIANNLLLFSGF